jgi:hypothetical protein
MLNHHVFLFPVVLALTSCSGCGVCIDDPVVAPLSSVGDAPPDAGCQAICKALFGTPPPGSPDAGCFFTKTDAGAAAANCPNPSCEI